MAASRHDPNHLRLSQWTFAEPVDPDYRPMETRQVEAYRRMMKERLGGARLSSFIPSAGPSAIFRPYRSLPSCSTP